ncbi:MAG: TonB-dependent receptor, partial [Sphingomonas sp.]
MTDRRMGRMPLSRKAISTAMWLTLLAPGAAFAQETSPQPAAEAEDVSQGGLTEIVVTAQKRDERLQETPLAVSATSGDALERRGVTSLADLNSLAPNVSIGQQNGINRLYIRGVGLSAYSTGSDPSTAFHVNGVVIGRGSAQLSSFFDVERIEVLRGPQGTLYGRNATAGSVNLITRKPTRDLSAYLNTTLGNYDHVQFEGAVSGPLDGAGNLRARIAFQTIDHDGYGQNVTLNKDIDNQKARAVRGTLAYDAGTGFDITLTGDYATEDDNNYAVYSFGPFVPGTTLLGQTLGGAHIANSRSVASDVLPINDRRNWGLSATVGVDLADAWRLQSITGYRNFRRFNMSDVENTSAAVASLSQTETSKQFSQELQLLYTSDRLTGIFGLYYYHEDMSGLTYVPLTSIGATFRYPDAKIHQIGTASIDAYAAFAQWTYEVVDNLRLTAGLRYSHEQRESEGAYTQFNFSFPTPANTTTPVAYDKSYNAFTPRFVIDYRPAEGVMLYASATRGFKSGVQIIGNTNPPVDPEFIWSYEAGTKLTLLDRRLELGLTGFLYDYTDLQINRPQGLAAIVVNAASARIKGIEFEARALPVDALTLNLDVSYLDAKFTDFPTTSPVYTSLGAINLAGNRLANAPEWTINAGAQYELPIEMPGKLSVRGDMNYTTRIYFTEYNDGARIVFPNGFRYVNDIQSQGAVATFNASLRYVTENERLSFTLFGKNLTNELVAANNIVGIQPFGYPVGGSYKAPRTYGITIGVKY